MPAAIGAFVVVDRAVDVDAGLLGQRLAAPPTSAAAQPDGGTRHDRRHRQRPTPRRRRARPTSGQPAFGGLEQEAADGEGAVEDVAEELLAAEHPGQRHRDGGPRC